MSVPRLVALDVDGTLADPEGVIRPRTLEAVAAVRAAGAEVVVATGRPWRIAERTIGEIGGAGWAVCSNGSMALRLGDEHEVIRNIFLPDDMPGPVVARLRKALPGIRFAFEFEFGAKSEPGWQERLPPGVPIGRHVDDILTLLGGERGPVRKVIAFHDDYDHRIADQLRSGHPQRIRPTPHRTIVARATDGAVRSGSPPFRDGVRKAPPTQTEPSRRL